MKLLVPNAVVGRLIGKGGANLKKTMAETDTFIICSKEDEMTRFTGDRIVSVVGNVENQTKAQNSITQQVKLYLQSQAPAAPMLAPKDKGPIHYDQGFVGLMRNGQRGAMDQAFPTYPFPRAVPIPPAYPPLPVPFRVAPELQDHEDTVVVQVPNGVVGSIIGKGGATIKDIASRSRTTIRVARNDEVDTNAANRAVSISGTLESIFKAQSMIFAKIAEAPPAIGGGADQPFRVELTIPNEMVGRIIGKKGSQVKKITEVSGARLTINQEEVAEGGEQPTNTIVTVTGRLDSNLLAQHLIQEILFYHQTPTE
jgi:transcription antitermination factor NusA-like protein